MCIKLLIILLTHYINFDSDCLIILFSLFVAISSTVKRERYEEKKLLWDKIII